MSDVERIKEQSRHLRGTLAEELAQDTPAFSEEACTLLKFHGAYQQDDRDARDERRRAGLDKAYIIMVRSKIPAGMLTAAQYLVHDRAADTLANGTLRITSRQGFQLHGVLKADMKTVIALINQCGLTTWGACGDVVRNVMAPPWPLNEPAYIDMRRLAVELKDALASQSRAYSEIWLDGEKLDLEQQPEEEPLYGEHYLPRKFKIGLAVPPRNEVDIYTHDIGLVPHVNDGAVEGYTILVGGGMGMTHGKEETHPVLAQPLGFAPRPHVPAVVKAIVTVQRDYGNRENRKRARMKYLLEERGLDWFRREVAARSGAPLSAPRPLQWTTVEDMLGWHEQGDGKLFCCLWVPDGRIKDETEHRYKSGFKAICERFGFPMALTPNCNLLFYNIEPSQRPDVDRLLSEYGIPHAEAFTAARKTAMACVALPTCGLALAESERVFQKTMDAIDAVLRELGLEREPILFRMTGCPNGCARPYNADFAFVGRSPNKYAFFVGGHSAGTRLGGLEQKTVALDAIPAVVRGYLERYVAERLPGESFSDYWGRTRCNGEAPHPAQFHNELQARKAALAAQPHGPHQE